MDRTVNRVTADITTGWFPLVQRSRPPCLPLKTRISELQRLARQARNGQIAQAAEVCNKAALIASDCGLPELARALCWRQHKIFEQARPLPASAAKLALQPLLNLARQLIREGDGEAAYTMLDTLYRAARDRADAIIDGRSVNLRDLTSGPDGHQTIRTLVWAALLADGTRALTLAGRWREAAERAAARRGVGQRLLDGRQTTIIALVHDGQATKAAALVDHATITQPWEHAVQQVLGVYCRRAAGATAGHRATAMLHAVLSLVQQADPSIAVFRTRVGLTALDLAGTHEDVSTTQLRKALITTAHNDAYAARDALAHPVLRRAMATREHRALAELVQAAGLGAKTIPGSLYYDLMKATSSAEKRLSALLDNPRCRPVPGSSIRSNDENATVRVTLQLWH